MPWQHLNPNHPEHPNNKQLAKPKNPNYIPPLTYEECARSEVNKLYSFQTILELAQTFTRPVILFDLNNLTPKQFVDKYKPTLI